MKCLVNNDDREIEFHDLLDESKAFFNEPERGNQSCEMMARALGSSLPSAIKGHSRSLLARMVSAAAGIHRGATSLTQPTVP